MSTLAAIVLILGLTALAYPRRRNNIISAIVAASAPNGLDSRAHRWTWRVVTGDGEILPIPLSNVLNQLAIRPPVHTTSYLRYTNSPRLHSTLNLYTHPYLRRSASRLPCLNCGRYLSRVVLRRHMRNGCLWYTRWNELRRILRIEANLHGQATTVDRMFFLIDFVLYTPPSLIQNVFDENEETASINSAIAETEASSGAGSPMETSPPSNSPTDTLLASQVADAAAGIADLDL
ncbi:hypothetical protein RhiJN_09566 [Ceratobasidium sp. AG-Ba]|nr:hypothetical protein RhiJN_09566 [Ceratobasidium sp. AG-Ba]